MEEVAFRQVADRDATACPGGMLNSQESISYPVVNRDRKIVCRLRCPPTD